MTTDPLLLELADTVASGREIALTVAGFQIRGQLSLEGAHLQLAGREGTVTATRLLVANATVMGHGLRLGGQALEATNATVSWGESGLRIRATSVDMRALQVIGDQERFDGTLVLEGITLRELAVHGSDVHAGQLRVAITKADVSVPARESNAASSNESSPMLERLLGLFDRLTGHVNVDLGLDLTVPVIGRRRATHHFRIPIDAGTVNYRSLEDNLSTLEDSLLDFSVRDDELVLEVGIPLLPTRGKGKPIVTWSLAAADLALAHEQRARLSVLARPNLKAKSEEADDDHKGPVSVRTAHAAGLDVQLAIAPAEDSPIRSVGALVLAGDITYATGESTDGILRGQAEKIELGAIGAGRFGIAGLRLDAAPEIEVGFAGVTPVRAKLVAQGIQLDEMHVASSVESDTASHGAGSGYHAPHGRAK